MTTDIDFTTPMRSPRAAHHPCIVCGLRADVLLCRECLDDIPAAHSRVTAWLDANDDQRDVVFDDWNRICSANLDAWEKIRKAQSLPDYAAKCAKHRRAGNIYGQLLDAHAAMLAQLAPLGIERSRLERALEILETM